MKGESVRGKKKKVAKTRWRVHGQTPAAGQGRAKPTVRRELVQR